MCRKFSLYGKIIAGHFFLISCNYFVEYFGLYRRPKYSWVERGEYLGLFRMSKYFVSTKATQLLNSNFFASLLIFISFLVRGPALKSLQKKKT